MIMITNGAEVLTVSNGAFQSQYKPFGWYPVADKGVIATPAAKEIREKKAREAAEVKVQKELKESIESGKIITSEAFVEPDKGYAEPEKPLSEMSDVELKEKAKSLNIDYKRFQSRKALRRAVVEAMRG